MARGLLAGSLLTITLALGSGCHSPSGGALPGPDGSFTYYSHEMRPVTITLVDVRSQEVIFAMDVPVGKQLSINFEDGGGADPVHAPDRMFYEVNEIGTKFGKLDNQLSVPPANVRRVDVAYRQGPEYRSAPASETYRIDQAANRADWWTADGGAMMDEDAAITSYDE